MKIKSKRLDNIRQLESQIIVCSIYWEKPCWRVEYLGKPIKTRPFGHQRNILNDGNDYLIDIFDTKREAIDYCKKYNAVIEHFSKDGYTMTTIEPSGKINRLILDKPSTLE
jgi:formylmethanofuran dehydrogenase subunit A